MRDPLESRLRLRCRFTLVLLRLYAAAVAAVFVLMLIILVFLYFCLCSFRAAFGPFFQVFSLTFWSCSKILLIFHHGEHGGHEEVFTVHATVFYGSCLKLGFIDRIEAERRKTALGSP